MTYPILADVCRESGAQSNPRHRRYRPPHAHRKTCWSWTAPSTLLDVAQTTRRTHAATKLEMSSVFARHLHRHRHKVRGPLTTGEPKCSIETAPTIEAQRVETSRHGQVSKRCHTPKLLRARKDSCGRFLLLLREQLVSCAVSHRN